MLYKIFNFGQTCCFVIECLFQQTFLMIALRNCSRRLRATCLDFMILLLIGQSLDLLIHNASLLLIGSSSFKQKNYKNKEEYWGGDKLVISGFMCSCASVELYQQ